MNENYLEVSLDSQMSGSLPIKNSLFWTFNIVAFEDLDIFRIHGDENINLKIIILFHLSFYFILLLLSLIIITGFIIEYLLCGCHSSKYSEDIFSFNFYTFTVR